MDEPDLSRTHTGFACRENLAAENSIGRAVIKRLGTTYMNLSLSDISQPQIHITAFGVILSKAT